MTTKRDELNKLQEFAKSFGPNSYLADLFTQDFLNWVTATVEADWSPNMKNSLDFYTDRAAQMSNDYNLEVQRHKLTKEAHKRELVNFNAQRENVEQKLAAEKERNHKLFSQRNELDQKVREQEAELQKVNAEMVELKALLFDLQNNRSKE